MYSTFLKLTSANVENFVWFSSKLRFKNLHICFFYFKFFKINEIQYFFSKFERNKLLEIFKIPTCNFWGWKFVHGNFFLEKIYCFLFIFQNFVETHEPIRQKTKMRRLWKFSKIEKLNIQENWWTRLTRFFQVSNFWDIFSHKLTIIERRESWNMFQAEWSLF